MHMPYSNCHQKVVQWFTLVLEIFTDDRQWKKEVAEIDGLICDFKSAVNYSWDIISHMLKFG